VRATTKTAKLRLALPRQPLCCWPLDKWPRTGDGKHGSQHTKITLADGQRMLISSANFTQYAITLNMEMGVLVHGGSTPTQAERLLPAGGARGV
jgi:cardiolipin synthase